MTHSTASIAAFRHAGSGGPAGCGSRDLDALSLSKMPGDIAVTTRLSLKGLFLGDFSARVDSCPSRFLLSQRYSQANIGLEWATRPNTRSLHSADHRFAMICCGREDGVWSRPQALKR